MQTPLSIDRIESFAAGPGSVCLRLSGRWLDPSRSGEEELLVVQVEGRRHRFPAHREREHGDAPQAWSATFTLPDWAEPRHDGQAALWIGNVVIPVAPPRAGRRPEPPPPASSPPPEPPRSGPLADLLLRETVAALHTELELRSGEAARLRGALAGVQSELEARIATQAALEAAHGELRSELERLTASIGAQRAELERHKARAASEQEAGSAEAESERVELERRIAGLTAERDRGADHLSALREQLSALREQLTAATAASERRVAESSRLHEDLAAATVARDAAVSEAAGLRDELERVGSELAVTRERMEAEDGGLGEAHRLLAEARALSRQLREE